MRAAAAAPPPPADDGPPGANGSGGGRGKPDDNDASQEDDKKDDGGLVGDNSVSDAAAAETQGRLKRRLGSSLRPRRRAPEELPPVLLPAGFEADHVYRHGQPRGSFFQETDPVGRMTALLHTHRAEVAEAQGSDRSKAAEAVARFEAGLSQVLEASLWDAPSVQEAVEDMEAGQPGPVAQRGSIALATAALAVRYIASAQTAPPSPSAEALDWGSLSHLLRGLPRPHLDKAYAMAELACRPAEGVNPGYQKMALRTILRSALPYQSHLDLGPLHYTCLQEAVSAVRSDLLIDCPKSTKTAEFKRPVTVLDFPYYSGSAWPRRVVEDVADEVGADVLHLTAQDIGNVVGSYLGQDVPRAAGASSLLGYNAASHSGRLLAKKNESDESDANKNVIPFLFIDGSDRSKRDPKKSPQNFLDGLLGVPNREKSDDMWEDLKINAAVEQLLGAADTKASERPPLIVHLHDFNALGMASSAILARFRKVVDGAWADGRRIVLVGTCSSLDAPKPYLDALRYHALTEHVIHLHASHSPSIVLDRLRLDEVLDENTANIKATLETLLKPSFDQGLPAFEFSLRAVKDVDLRESLQSSVLPLSEVYRIAKTAIGLQRHQHRPLDQALLDEALQLVTRIDEQSALVTKSRRGPGREGQSAKDLFAANVRGGDPRSENHEEKMLSGLVNAKDIRTTFKDVHAPQDTIDSVRMLTQLSLQRPEAFSYGVLATDRIPGCLLYGPPGTGKTLLAKAVAKESGANMIEVSAATINNMFVGESEKNVRALFQLAKKKEPMVIFIDEADALLGARGPRNGGNQREVMNQFLREWDGLDTMKAFIMVATNRPFDLDDAVLRRLPRKLLVDLPLEADRAAILRIHLKDEALDASVSIEQLAKQTPLYSGSDLKNVCVAAAMAAVKEELEAAQQHTGAEPYQHAPKRVLARRHFDKGLAEISASISEDMSTMNAIRKFDERYGDGKARKKRRGMGFGVGPEATDSHDARVRGAASP